MRFLKEYLPPFLIKKATGLFYGWSGSYKTWEEAKSKCTGYDSGIIFEKVKDSLLKVKNGTAVYERDSVIFDKVYYAFPLLAALYHVAIQKKDKLRVLDFGGSMGSSYFQNRKLLENIGEYHWSIVEQRHFVEEGIKSFSDEHLKFYYDISSCLNESVADVILLSSVLQYIEEPYVLLDEILSQNIPYLIIDRAPVLLQGSDRITIQKVPKKIYKASYPCWLLNEKKLIARISEKYEMVFDEFLGETINISTAAYRFYFFKLKNS